MSVKINDLVASSPVYTDANKILVSGSSLPTRQLKYISEYADLATALSTIGSAETTIWIDQDTAVVGTQTISSTLEIGGLLNGAMFTGTGTLVINGPFNAPDRQVFASGLTVSLPSVERINVVWFNGVFQSAINALGARGGWVYDSRNGETIECAGWTHARGVCVKLGSNRYNLTSTIYVDFNCMLIGDTSVIANYGTELWPKSGENIGDIVSGIPAVSGYYLHNLIIRGLRIHGGYNTSNVGSCINVATIGENSTIEHCLLTQSENSCLKIRGMSVPARVEAVMCQGSNAGYGVEVDCASDGDSAGNAYCFDGLSCDKNKLGGILIKNGNDRSTVNFYSLKTERTLDVTFQLNVIDVQNFEGTINLFGFHCHSTTGFASGNAVIAITVGTIGTRPRVNLIGGSCRLFTYWIDDQVNSVQITRASTGNYCHDIKYGFASQQYIVLNANGYYDMYIASAGNDAIKIRVLGDADARTEIRPGGIQFGDGTNPVDVQLSRLTLGVIGTDAIFKDANTTDATSDATGAIVTEGGISCAKAAYIGTNLNAGSKISTPKAMMTPEGGFAIKLTNKTGAVSVKGEVVDANGGQDNSVAKVVDGVPDSIGVFYESGVADGAEAWIVVSGIAAVYFIGNATRGHLARTFVSGEAGYVTGQAKSEALPSPPFDDDKHFCEIGHVLQSRTGAGLANVNLHFN